MSSQYISYGARGGGGGVASYATFAAFPTPISVGDGVLAIAIDTGNLYETVAGAWVVIASPGVATSIGSPANGLSLASNILSLALASGSQTGALSSTDWTTFNNKQAALGFTPENSANKGAANGYASLDATGLVPITQVPPAALERLVIVADQTARYALTTAIVQNGDTVKQTDTGVLYFVKDDTNLNNAAGYEVYAAGTAASVPWSGITGVPSPVSSLSGTNTGDVSIGTANGLSLAGQVLSLAAASAGTTGALSSTDWSTFNSKQAALTIGNFSESTSSVLTIVGGTGAVIGSGLTVQVKQSSGSQDGYLSSADWTTFNSKHPAGSFVASATYLDLSSTTKPTSTISAGLTMFDSLDSSKDAEYAAGSPTLTLMGSASYAAGQLNLAGAASTKYAYFSAVGNCNFGSGAIRFRIKPNYTGVPPVVYNQYICSVATDPGGNDTNAFGLWHRDSGFLAFWDNSGGSTTSYNWSPTAGQTYEFEINWSGSALYLFIDGVLVYSTLSATFNVPNATHTYLVFGAPNAGANFSDFYISEVVCYNAMQHTVPYSAPSPVPSIGYKPDGTDIATDDTVLFTGLSADNNRVYKATVSGSSISWAIQALGANPSGAPTLGDDIFILSGSVHQRETRVYNGTTFVGAAGVGSSGTNTGDVTLAAVGAVPNANGASLSGQVLSLQPANATNPGVVTTGAQTFAGAKTFSSTISGSVSGTAANITGIAAIANGGTGASTQQGAINALAGAITAGYYLRGDGSNISLSAIQAGDVPTLNQNTTGSAAKWTTARSLGGNSVDGSANVAFANAFIVQGTTDAGLSGAQFLGALGTGILKNTTTTGVLSIAIPSDFPTLNQNTTGTASNITGVAAIANGGTGQTTAAAAFNALSPMTTGGDLIYGGASGAGTRLANGTSGHVLTSNGGTAAPSWQAIPPGTAPTGAVMMYAGTSAPSGWLMCDGSQVSRTTYASLYAVTGNAFGSGDGSTTFHLPDMQGRFPRGVDGTASRDPDKATRSAMNSGGNTGNNVGSVQLDEYRSHGHSLYGASLTGLGGGPFHYALNNSTGAGFLEANSAQPAGGNESRPVNAYFYFIIKT